MDKAIITAAVTGSIHIPSLSPYLPITPQQIADEVVRVHEAGGAVAHVHVRNPETGQPSSNMELYRGVLTKIKSKCNIVLCLSTGGGVGMTTAERVKSVTTFEPELASFNFGSINFGLFPIVDAVREFKFPWEKPYLEGTWDFIFPNTFKTLREFSQAFEERGTKPELEIYDAGMINNAAFMIQRGYLKKPVYLQFVLGILGSMPASSSNLLFMYNSARETMATLSGRYVLLVDIKCRCVPLVWSWVVMRELAWKTACT